MILSAKEFAERTGFPLAMIRRMCRNGNLPHWKNGRVYLLDVDKALAAMQLQKEAVAVNNPLCEAKINCRVIKNDMQGPQRLRELMKRKRAPRCGNSKAQV